MGQKQNADVTVQKVVLSVKSSEKPLSLDLARSVGLERI